MNLLKNLKMNLLKDLEKFENPQQEEQAQKPNPQGVAADPSRPNEVFQFLNNEKQGVGTSYRKSIS